MEPNLIRVVLPPPEEPARRLLQGVIEALRASRPDLTVEPIERLDLPTFGRMAAGPALVVSDRPLALPPDTLGLFLLTRWSAEAIWAKCPSHLIAVPHPGLVDQLARLGLPRSRIQVSGLPVALTSGPAVAQEEARKRLGLGPLPHGLLAVLVEGLDASRLDQILFQLTMLDPPTTIVFFAGEDPALQAVIRRRVPALGLDARLLSNSVHLKDILAAASLAITSSEGVPSTEALAAGVPTLVVPAARPIGEEEARFLGDLGVARAILDIRTLAAEIDVLRGDRESREKLRTKATAVLRPEPMAALLGLVQRGLAEREQLLQPVPLEPMAGGSAAGANRSTGVLEDLGGRPTNPSAHGERTTGEVGRDERGKAEVGGKPQPVRTMTELIIIEKATRAKHHEMTTELARWRRRIGLAIEAGEVQLQELAAQEVQRLESIVARLDEKLEQLARYKLEAQKGKPRAGAAENRFRQLELDSDLKSLKKKMDH